jgi:hypothetical protein
MDAKGANGPYWDPRQPLPPAPLVRDAILAENLRSKKNARSTNNAGQSKKGS